MIEIQVHPSDIRRRVRYFFFDRRRVVFGIIGLTLLLFAILGSMAAAPTVIRRVYKTNFLHSMRDEREIQRARLSENVAQMTSLEKSLEQQTIRVQKLVTIYGLERSLGQGGLSVPTPASQNPAEQLNHARRRELALKTSMHRLEQQLSLLAEYERANREIVLHTPSILPLPAEAFVLTSPFGQRISPFTRSADFHKGLDLSAPRGTNIFATADGVVTFAGRFPISQSVAWWRFGNVVVVSHADRFITIYAHCDDVRVRAGQQVRQGEVIATVGSTGWSTNSHLHYEVRSDIEKPGTLVPIDPRIYILNYQWNNEAALLMKARTSRDYKELDPLPSAFVGKRRVL
jgi:murein DD-endopeptidase MepM/ murein hydrolase activator NlpD